MDPVREYALELDPDDFRWFARNLGSERCFPARLTTDRGEFAGWVGYRGRFSRYCPKPSYDWWFGDPSGGRLHLNAAYYDPALLRTRLSFGLFEELGVPVPRTWHVQLTLNGDAMGLYTAIEGVDQYWLRHRGIEGGQIYYGVGGLGNFGLLNRKTGKRKRYLAQGYEKCHPADDDVTDLEELILRITLADEAEFTAGIAEVVDVEEYLRWLVGAVFISHTDGLVQNYALVTGPDGRWQISPWDCDGTWGRCPDGGVMPADYLELEAVGGNFLTARLLASQRWRARYIELWEESLAGPLRPERLIERIGALFEAIRPAALRDQLKGFSNRTFSREPGRLRRYVEDRLAFLQAQVALGTSAIRGAS
jgi:spore coat protein H